MRTCRVYLADMATASVTAGSIMSLNVPPEDTTGNSRSCTQNTRISRSPTQKLGMDTPKKVMARTM